MLVDVSRRWTRLLAILESWSGARRRGRISGVPLGGVLLGVEYGRVDAGAAASSSSGRDCRRSSGGGVLLVGAASSLDAAGAGVEASCRSGWRRPPWGVDAAGATWPRPARWMGRQVKAAQDLAEDLAEERRAEEIGRARGGDWIFRAAVAIWRRRRRARGGGGRRGRKQIS